MLLGFIKRGDDDALLSPKTDEISDPLLYHIMSTPRVVLGFDIYLSHLSLHNTLMNVLIIHFE